VRVLVRHPVPVRWRPPRAPSDRHALMAATTPVEVPEFAESDMVRRREAVSHKGVTLRFSVHAGRCWFPVPRHGLCAGWTGATATPRDLASYLSERPGTPGFAVLERSPLLGPTIRKGSHAPWGDDLPDSVLSRAASDLTEPVRRALRHWIPTNFAVAGDAVYASCPLPVYAPHAEFSRLLMSPPREVGSKGFGLVVEPSRLGLAPSYLRRMGARAAVPEEVEEFFLGMGDIPFQGHDLAVFANDGPVQAEAIAANVAGQAWARELDLSPLDPHLARLAPYADLGRVGAVPVEDYAALTETLRDALAAIRGLVPRDRNPRPLNWLRAYADCVAAPAVGVGSIPEEDAETLAGLARGG
jgi:hypothetical protein